MRALKERFNYSFNSLYRVIGVSKQAVNQHKKRLEEKCQRTFQLLEEVDMIRSEHPGCGVEKMYGMLQPYWLGRDRFIKLLMTSGYRVKKVRNYIRTTYSVSSNYYPNYIEGMQLTDINRLIQTDITYFMIGDKFHYITFIIDVYSRKIIVYAASNTMRVEANIRAMKMALQERKGMCLDKLIHHSDRGGQYNAKEYINLLQVNKITVSMGKKAQDNAYAERINGIIKNEYLKYKTIKTYADLKRELRRSVRHYNAKRPHNSLAKRSTPIDFERNLLSLFRKKRPKVIVYADGNYKIKEASSLFNFRQEEEPQVPACPIKIEMIV